MSSNLSQIKKRIASLNDRKNVVRGIEAMDYLHHGHQVSIIIVTPLGGRFKIDTQFIGYDDDARRLYFSIPEMRIKEFEDFFVEQYWVSVTSFSEQGEGGMIRFRNRIEFIMTEPVRIFTLKVPAEAELYELRQEIRYRIDMKAHIALDKRRLEVEISDISSNGCRFNYTEPVPVFDIDREMLLIITNPFDQRQYTLSGIIRNFERSRGKQIYGLMYDEKGKEQSQNLLSALIFNGAKLVFSQSNKEAKSPE
jgi:hypothetical protein